MPLLDLEALRQAPLVREPFNFTVVKDAIRPVDAAAIRDDFPDIRDSGLLPVEATRYGPKFGRLIDELKSEQAARAFSEKFGVNLVSRPQMITVRGRCALRDGRIHTDTPTKLITVLIYFNDRWEARGGRLRLLRSPTDLGDMIGEAPPDSGTMIAFRRSDKSFHGRVLPRARALRGGAAIRDDQLDDQRLRRAARAVPASAIGARQAGALAFQAAPRHRAGGRAWLTRPPAPDGVAQRAPTRRRR
jgi:hypothetical protein